MPQMAPISWMSLYMYFTILFMLTCMMNYFMVKYLPKTQTIKMKKNINFWKW
uniref:ATP synthase F0 subunit 8 n=1 Tax=Cyclorhipidion bodoanum TaxID=2566501 RepID=A0A343A6N9_9CUCU|nr:ATP synthase F0 subunit 8 [Cyclorhipidion bodoanus]AOY40244.1 ATP synthase F0 subunit 8 [Cyclorhipidion bodoanus]